jgi:hypothetical protein
MHQPPVPPDPEIHLLGKEKLLNVTSGAVDITVRTLVVGEVVPQVATGEADLVLEEVGFVEKEDHGRRLEEAVVHDLRA